MSAKKVIMDSQILSTLMVCPRLCHNRFGLHLQSKEGKSNSLEVGSLAHVILEWYNKSLIAGKPRSEAIAIGFEAGKEYVNGYQPNNKYVTDPKEKGMVNSPSESTSKPSRVGYNFVFKRMEQYFDYYRNDNWTPIAAEEVRGKVIYSDSDLEVLWKAKYDLISDSPFGFISTDHKTMSQNRDTLALNNQFIGQCVLLGSRNVMINKIGWQTSLPEEKIFVRAMISYSADRLAEWVNEIVPHYANMLLAYDEAGYYPPNYASCEGKYGRCNFYEPCDSDRNMRDEVLKMNFIEGEPWDVSND